eukprot:RCo020218
MQRPLWMQWTTTGTRLCMGAAGYGHSTVAELLLAANASPTAVTQSGLTARSMAGTPSSQSGCGNVSRARLPSAARFKEAMPMMRAAVSSQAAVWRFRGRTAVVFCVCTGHFFGF